MTLTDFLPWMLVGLFIGGIVLLLLRMPGWKPDGSGMLTHALIIPVSAAVLLFVAFSLIFWGVQADPRETMDFAGEKVSVSSTSITGWISWVARG